MNKYNRNQQQRIKHLTYAIEKFTQSNRKVPQELYDEQEYAGR
jgi:hypothetical protein